LNAYEILLKGHEEVAAGTMAFHFNEAAGLCLPAGPGGLLALIDPPAEPNSRQRYLLPGWSAPFEAELAIATRMRDGSAFKRALKNLRPGAKLQ
jgi:hypothetical protein